MLAWSFPLGLVILAKTKLPQLVIFAAHIFLWARWFIGLMSGQFWAMGRLNLLGGQINLLAQLVNLLFTSLCKQLLKDCYASKSLSWSSTHPRFFLSHYTWYMLHGMENTKTARKTRPMIHGDQFWAPTNFKSRRTYFCNLFLISFGLFQNDIELYTQIGFKDLLIRSKSVKNSF